MVAGPEGKFISTTTAGAPAGAPSTATTAAAVPAAARGAEIEYQQDVGVLVLFHHTSVADKGVVVQVSINDHVMGILHHHEMWQIPLKPGTYSLK